MSSETKIGNYFIEQPIGRGGMGVVYKGHHAKLPREVAIKSISARGTHDLRRLRHRFEREAYVQSQLDHPSIVKIYDYIVAEQTYYIVMEYVEGRSLAQLLAQEGRALDVNRALDLFEQILSAVAYAHSFVYRDDGGASHRGIIHRDLKPANILVASGDQIKITDFGIVKLVGAAGDTTDTSGLIYGSPHYVSPEQAAGAIVDQRSDIYSLGVILYEMLTGRRPFDNDDEPLKRTEILRAHVERTARPPSELNPEVTPDVERLVCRALEKKPERRFADALDYQRAVRHARGRDASDIVDVNAQAASARVARAGVEEAGGATERTGEPTEHPSRDTYHTQPIFDSVCGACGAEAARDDARCRECGHDLNASPATTNLSRRAVNRRERTRAVVVTISLVALALLSITLYFYGRRSTTPRSDDARTEPTAAAAPSPASNMPPTPVPPSSLVELRAASVAVDSSFDGYGTEALTDGVTDVRRIAAMRYNKGNWASAETPLPHWIEFGLAQPARLAAVYVYWGFDRNRYVPSRRVELQIPDARGDWQTVSTLEAGDDHDRAAFEFAPLETSRFRIFQPAQQGPKNRPFVMWVREVRVFGDGNS